MACVYEGRLALLSSYFLLKIFGSVRVGSTELRPRTMRSGSLEGRPGKPNGSSRDRVWLILSIK